MLFVRFVVFVYNEFMSTKKWQDWLFDAWCIVSVIGIWPRFIEPSIIQVKKISLSIPLLSQVLRGLTFIHFSDLHYSAAFSPYLKRKLIRKINDLSPDYIFFTGDFLCRSNLEDKEGMRDFLCHLKAKQGCFCVLGNHDYSEFITVNEEGDYDTKSLHHISNASLGFRRLFSSRSLSRVFTEGAKKAHIHQELCELLHSTPFRLLHNQTVQLCFSGHYFNLCGLGEYMCHKFNPEEAFANYNPQLPGIVLVHNPDTFPHLRDFPGELILAGHTHGGQLNLPFLWKRFTKIEHLEYKRGLKFISDKRAYINRGISSVMPFRWFSLPEITYCRII